MERSSYRIIGTAGHIDHGKSCLVKALTGTDPDRLQEEKKRGITIENGFAFLPLKNGKEAGIIDVPGHEKFIKNMLAGAGGIHIAMLVIAVNEGVMTQTVEHLEILSLLGIRRGVVVLTKCDLEWRENLKVQVRKLVKGTFLEQAPVVETSAVSGTGIKELQDVLEGLCMEETPCEESSCEETEQKGFRLPIDRVFSLKGFGTVVTGTVVDGELSLNSQAVLYPCEEGVKIRQIQVNGKAVESAYPGQRAAVNLLGKKQEEISRGEILAQAGSMQISRIADVKLCMTKSSRRILKNGQRVHLYHGASEAVCRVYLMEGEQLLPGEEGMAQLRIERETAMKKGDHFVIRFYSPLETIGGGVVLNPNGSKRRKKKTETQNSECIMQTKETETKEVEMKEIETNPLHQRLDQLYLEKGFAPPETAEVKAMFGKQADFSQVFFSMVRSGELVRYDEKHYMHPKVRNKAYEMAERLFLEKGFIATGEFRDRLEIPRKCAITLLEGFDKEHRTILKDGVRVLLLAGTYGNRTHPGRS